MYKSEAVNRQSATESTIRIEYLILIRFHDGWIHNNNNGIFYNLIDSFHEQSLNDRQKEEVLMEL